MTKRVTTAALCAKTIRHELKQFTLPCTPRVTSDNFAGGNSVNVKLEDVDPTTLSLIKQRLDKYEYGHFNGMEDIYEISNSRPDVPQVKFLSIDNHTSLAMRQRLYDAVRADHPQVTAELPATYSASNDYVRIYEEYLCTWMHRYFTGASGDFWNTERLSA